MKKTIISSLLLLGSTSILANTTMCFKENHNSMSTIESTKLDGGECKSLYSINEMKSKGWSVDDIKITTTSNGMNFIYILKQANTNLNSNIVPSLSSEDMEKRILANLQKKKEEEQKAKELEEKINLEDEGEKLYTTKCQSCHGQKGEIKVYNVSKALNTLSLEEIQDSLRDYKLYSKDNGYAIVMIPYAKSFPQSDIEKVYAYLQKINKN